MKIAREELEFWSLVKKGETKRDGSVAVLYMVKESSGAPTIQSAVDRGRHAQGGSW